MTISLKGVLTLTLLIAPATLVVGIHVKKEKIKQIDSAFDSIPRTSIRKLAPRFPWRRPPGDTANLHAAIETLRPGMSYSEVLKIAGIPDSIRKMPNLRLFSIVPHRPGYTFAYELLINGPDASTHDKTIILKFSHSGHLDEIFGLDALPSRPQ